MLYTLDFTILNDGASIINLSSINAYTGMPNTASPNILFIIADDLGKDAINGKK